MEQEKVDPETGEVSRAVDGSRIPHAATTAGEFLNMIEDGQFSADLNTALSDLAAEMTDLAAATGNKQKGTVTIVIDFTSEGGPFTIAGKYKVKAPEEKRRRTLVWTDEHNRFTRHQPRQGQFFGVREVGGTGPVRTL